MYPDISFQDFFSGILNRDFQLLFSFSLYALSLHISDSLVFLVALSNAYPNESTQSSSLPYTSDLAVFYSENLSIYFIRENCRMCTGQVSAISIFHSEKNSFIRILLHTIFVSPFGHFVCLSLISRLLIQSSCFHSFIISLSRISITIFSKLYFLRYGCICLHTLENVIFLSHSNENSLNR